MTPDELLCELESLTHDNQMKRIVEIVCNGTLDANAASAQFTLPPLELC